MWCVVSGRETRHRHRSRRKACNRVHRAFASKGVPRLVAKRLRFGGVDAGLSLRVDIPAELRAELLECGNVKLPMELGIRHVPRGIYSHP